MPTAADADPVASVVPTAADADPVASVVPTAAEAAKFLYTYATTVKQGEVVNAIAVLLDHIARCEETLTMIRNGYESAIRYAPDPVWNRSIRTRG
jgi:hypothetical protein